MAWHGMAARNITRKAPEAQTTNRLAEFDVGNVLRGARVLFPSGTVYIQARVRWSTGPVSMYPHVLLLPTHTSGYVDMYSALGILSTQTTPAAISIVRLPLPHNLPHPPAKAEGRERKTSNPGTFFLSFLLFLFLPYSASRLAPAVGRLRHETLLC